MLTDHTDHAVAGVTDPAIARLAELLDPLAKANTLLLAVSGGPDSTALMHIAAAWHRSGNLAKVAVACVDHGLRSGSKAEAEAVLRAAEALDLPAVRLVWADEKPTRGLPAAARSARYRLLVDHANAIGASHIATAHTMDDQAETVLMRMAAGSGLSGLSGMQSAVDWHGPVLARPFLGVSKAELVALCDANQWSYVVDPTNRNPAYARSRWRALAPQLASEGLTPQRVARLASRAARADAALDHVVARLEQAIRLPAAGGTIRLDFDRLATEPFEIVLRVLSRALIESSGLEQPRLDRLERLSETLLHARSAALSLRRTLHRCLVTLGRDGALSVEPEGERHRGRKAALQHIGAFPSAQGAGATASLGKPLPPSYIGRVDATARLTEAVEPHSASGASAWEPMLCTGPQ